MATKGRKPRDKTAMVLEVRVGKQVVQLDLSYTAEPLQLVEEGLWWSDRTWSRGVGRFGSVDAQVGVDVDVGVNADVDVDMAVGNVVDVGENLVGATGVVQGWKELAMGVAGRMIKYQKLQVSRKQLNVNQTNQPATQILSSFRFRHRHVQESISITKRYWANLLSILTPIQKIFGPPYGMILRTRIRKKTDTNREQARHPVEC